VKALALGLLGDLPARRLTLAREAARTTLCVDAHNRRRQSAPLHQHSALPLDHDPGDHAALVRPRRPNRTEVEQIP